MVAGVDGQPAAGQVLPEAPGEGHVRVGGIVHEERGPQTSDRAQLASVDQAADGPQGRAPAVASAEAVEDARAPTGCQHLGRHDGRDGERLLAHDVLAGGRSREHDVAVEDRRQAGHDQIHVVGGDDAAPVLLDTLVAEPLGQIGRQVAVHVAHGDQPRVAPEIRIQHGEGVQRDAVGPRHDARADHRDAQVRRALAAHRLVSARSSSIRTRRPSFDERAIASQTSAAS